MPEMLKEIETKMTPTIKPPPIRMITWALTTLKARAAKGDYPPSDWIESLEAIEQALKENEAMQIELLAQADVATLPCIDPSGIDVTAFVGSCVTTETLTMLHAEMERRHGESWVLFAEPTDGELWKVTKIKARAE